eukprot:TRINITY_DN83315_c0_g1_i1.p1 TRINITY_DN83315_c0_g1~~TRINITY_DN83315_c0_g1_i1.p1  ORF type:complete len:233 (+),score=48.82 TRINITY_DN83315_c0_g1_i1:108-806(+)
MSMFLRLLGGSKDSNAKERKADFQYQALPSTETARRIASVPTPQKRQRERAKAHKKKESEKSCGEEPGKDWPKATLAGRDSDGQRRWNALTTHPQDLFFHVPEDARVGEVLTIRGPHGPMPVPLPEDAEPGKLYKLKIRPNADFKVSVPQHWRPGDKVDFEGPNGQHLVVDVPPGYRAGDQFDVTPPTAMVQIPEHARPGDKLVFNSMDCKPMEAEVPSDLKPLHYFAVPLL